MNDNMEIPNRGEVSFDCLYKVKLLPDCILEHFRSILREEPHFGDEQIIPTKSKSLLRHYRNIPTN